jgi:hypothetical protein
MATQGNFYPPNQQFRMQQSNPTTPYNYSRDGRDPSHTSYRQTPPQHQVQQMPLLAPMVNSTQPKGILRNSYQQAGNNPSYSQQNNDMVRSLMAQLREKEAELAKYKVTYNEFQKTEQTNRGLKSRLDAQTISMADKDKKIAMLVGKLNLEKRSNGSAVADAIADTKIKRLNEQLEEIKREMKSRDDEIARLNAQNKMFMLRAIEYEKKASFQTNSLLEQELTALKEKFAHVNEQNSTSKNTIEELVKRVKAKEWMINSLRSESEEQRNRETRLNAQVNALQQTIESYDTMFGGKNADIDVPMLLAKLADYETQAKQQKQQQQHQTGSTPDLQRPQAKTVDFNEEESVLSKEKKLDDGTIVSNDESMGNTIDDQDDDDDDDDDDGTFVTMKTMDDTFAPTTASAKYYNCADDFNPKNQDNVFNDLMEEVTEGMQSIKRKGITCGVNDIYEIFSEEPTDIKKDASLLEILLGL